MQGKGPWAAQGCTPREGQLPWLAGALAIRLNPTPASLDDADCLPCGPREVTPTGLWLSTGFLLVLLLWFLCPTGQLRSQPSCLMNPNSDTHTWLGHLQALCPETWEQSLPAPPLRGSRGEPLFPLGTPSVLHVHDLGGVGGAWFSIPVSGQR